MRLKVLSICCVLACGEPPEAPPASDATDAEAESCLKTKIWESNREGWSVRNSGTVRLGGGAFKSFAVNLYTSREYQLMACGAGWAQTVGLQLYNDKGERVESAKSAGRQPEFTLSPPAAGQYFVVVQTVAHTPKPARSLDGSVSLNRLTHGDGIVD